MATLFTRKGRKGWTARFLIDGKRIDRVTGLESKREAQRQAAIWEAELRKASTPDAGLQKAFQAILDNASRMAQEKRLTLDTVKDYLTKLHQLANPEFTEPTMDEVFTEWLEDQKARGITESTASVYEQAKKNLKEGLGAAWNQPAHLVTRRMIETAMRCLKSRVTAATVNLSFRAWRRVFTAAMERKTVTENPTAYIKPLPETDSVRRAPFTPTEARALLDAADGEWRGLILVGAHTGLRMMDCVQISKTDVVDGFLVVTPAKTKRHRKVIHIPVTLQLADWIKTQPADVLFPVLRKKSKQLLSGAFKDFMVKAKVPASITVPGGEVRVRSFHSLRHSANSWLASGGVDVGTRQQILGHASAAQNLAYTTASAEDRRKAISALPDLLPAAKG